jgi:hypothetical protein
MILLLLIVEWFGRKNKFALEKIGLYINKPLRWGLYFLLIAIIVMNKGKNQEFIYFQF